jgi:hypothetical protein
LEKVYDFNYRLALLTDSSVGSCLFNATRAVGVSGTLLQMLRSASRLASRALPKARFCLKLTHMSMSKFSAISVSLPHAATTEPKAASVRSTLDAVPTAQVVAQRENGDRAYAWVQAEAEVLIAKVCGLLINLD